MLPRGMQVNASRYTPQQLDEALHQVWALGEDVRRATGTLLGGWASVPSGLHAGLPEDERGPGWKISGKRPPPPAPAPPPPRNILKNVQRVIGIVLTHMRWGAVVCLGLGQGVWGGGLGNVLPPPPKSNNLQSSSFGWSSGGWCRPTIGCPQDESARSSAVPAKLPNARMINQK